MSIPATAPTSATAAPRLISRLREFTATADARPALLGCLGAVLITMGGLGAGSTKQHDPLLETLHLSWLRYGHGLVLSSIALWIGVTLMLSAWLWLGRRALAGAADQFAMVASAAFWLAPLLLSVPLFSRDTYSYLAQGALLRDGLEPYAVGPIDNPNALLDNVSPIWTITNAPYGPAFIMIARLVTMLVGNRVIVGTMLLRLCMLPGLALLIWATPRIARHVGANVPIALWICVLNPLVIVHLMGGVHNEMLMVGLMAAGIALTFDRRPIAGIAVVAVGMAVKATAGLALPFLVWVWMAPFARPARIPGATGLFGGRGRIGTDCSRGLRHIVRGGRGGSGLVDGAGRLGENHQLAEHSDGDRESASRPRRLEFLWDAAGYPCRGDRDHRDRPAPVVVAVPPRRPPGARWDRMGDARRGAVRARRPAVVLLLAIGGTRPARPVTARGGRHRGALHVDHGHLQTRWRPRHVLLAARAAGHRGGSIRLAHAQPIRVPGPTGGPDCQYPIACARRSTSRA